MRQGLIVPSHYHIGLPKTGTTSLQTVFGRDDRVRQIRSERTLAGGDWWREQYGVENHDALVLVESDETIITHSAGKSGLPVVLSRIRQVAPEGHIIVTIREQRSLLVSHYKHSVTYDYRDGFDDYYLENGMGLRVLGAVDYASLDTTIRAFFPRERVHYLLFEDLCEDFRAFIDDVYGILGIDPPDDALLVDPIRNPAMGDASVDVMRRLNGLRSLLPRRYRRAKWVRRRLMSASRRLERFAAEDPAAAWRDAGLFDLIDSDIRRWNREFVAAGAIEEERLRRHGYLL